MDVLNEWSAEDATMTNASPSFASRAKLSNPSMPSRSPGRAGASDLIDRRSASNYIRVDVAGTKHLDFTDMNDWGGPLRQRGAYGDIPPGRAAEVTRTIVREFFAQEILGEKAPLLSGHTKWADVTVEELRKEQK